MTFRAVVDFTDETCIKITYCLTGTFSAGGEPEASHTYQAEYTLTAKDGSLSDTYDLAIGGSHSILSDGEISRSI